MKEGRGAPSPELETLFNPPVAEKLLIATQPPDDATLPSPPSRLYST